MPYTVSKQDDDIMVTMEGVLTFHQHKEADELVTQVSRQIDNGAAAVRFDLEKVYSMDSHWLGIIIRVLRRAREKNVPLTVERPSADVRRLFEVVQMDRVVTIK